MLLCPYENQLLDNYYQKLVSETWQIVTEEFLCPFGSKIELLSIETRWYRVRVTASSDALHKGIRADVGLEKALTFV